MSGVTEKDPGLELYERMDPVEGFSTEYIHGEIVMMASPRMMHNRIVELVRECFPLSDFARWSTQAVAITARNDRPGPDLTVAPLEHAEDDEAAVPSEWVLFVLEVVSTTRPSKRRDYEDKAELYAQGGIPVYLLVDPNDGTWQLHTEPDQAGAEYRTLHKGMFGEPINLPEPLGLTVPKDRFRRYS